MSIASCRPCGRLQAQHWLSRKSQRHGRAVSAGDRGIAGLVQHCLASWQDLQHRHISFRELRKAALAAASVLRSWAAVILPTSWWRRPALCSGDGLVMAGNGSSARVGLLLDKAPHKFQGAQGCPHSPAELDSFAAGCGAHACFAGDLNPWLLLRSAIHGLAAASRIHRRCKAQPER